MMINRDISLEKEVKEYFDKNKINFRDSTDSKNLLDFKYLDPVSKFVFSFDTKEKLQKYNMNNWTDLIPEKDCFIIDELGIKKVMCLTPDSGIIVKDGMTGKYVFFNCLDFLCMPKIRANRRINYNTESLKGKWILNLENGIQRESLSEIFSDINDYMSEKDHLFYKKIECYKNYIGEDVEIKGIIRTNYYKNIDYNITR